MTNLCIKWSNRNLTLEITSFSVSGSQVLARERLDLFLKLISTIPFINSYHENLTLVYFSLLFILFYSHEPLFIAVKFYIKLSVTSYAYSQCIVGPEMVDDTCGYHFPSIICLYETCVYLCAYSFWILLGLLYPPIDFFAYCLLDVGPFFNQKKNEINMQEHLLLAWTC